MFTDLKTPSSNRRGFCFLAPNNACCQKKVAIDIKGIAFKLKVMYFCKNPLGPLCRLLVKMVRDMLNTFTPQQIKAARALLDWSQEFLAEISHLSVATIRKIEQGQISPRCETLQTISQAFASAGIEFIDSDGVRRRSDELMSFVGNIGRQAFFDDALSFARNTASEILFIDSIESAILCSAEGQRFLNAIVSDTLSVVKCIFVDAACIRVMAPQIQYRQVSRHYLTPAPLCIYGEKIFIFSGAGMGMFKAVSVRSNAVVETQKAQFSSIWEKTTDVMAPVSKGIY